jgi:hypothetical protein
VKERQSGKGRIKRIWIRCAACQGALSSKEKESEQCVNMVGCRLPAPTRPIEKNGRRARTVPWRQAIERRGRWRRHWLDVMRELQGTRSKSGQGSYRARQRLSGLLRGVAVSAALVWTMSGREGGGVQVGLGVARLVCSMLLSLNHDIHTAMCLRLRASVPISLRPVASKCIFWQLLNVQGPQIAYASGTRSASALPVV